MLDSAYLKGMKLDGLEKINFSTPRDVISSVRSTCNPGVSKTEGRLHDSFSADYNQVEEIIIKGHRNSGICVGKIT